MRLLHAGDWDTHRTTNITTALIGNGNTKYCRADHDPDACANLEPLGSANSKPDPIADTEANAVTDTESERKSIEDADRQPNGQPRLLAADSQPDGHPDCVQPL